jgi:outer membrane murein-binding lipoprotein Lpp
MSLAILSMVLVAGCANHAAERGSAASQRVCAQERAILEGRVQELTEQLEAERARSEPARSVPEPAAPASPADP